MKIRSRSNGGRCSAGVLTGDFRRWDSAGPAMIVSGFVILSKLAAGQEGFSVTESG